MNPPTFQPPLPSPLPKAVKIQLRQLIDSWEWTATVNKYPDGSADRVPTQEIIAGALLTILDALRAHHRSDCSALLLAELRDLRKWLARQSAPAKPTAAERQAERQAEREAATRQRAWAAYLKAGGQMEPEGEVSPLSLNRLIADLKLSVRARKAALRLNCLTIGDLVKLTSDDLMQAKNFGFSSLQEVREKLAAHGLTLQGESLPTEGT